MFLNIDKEIWGWGGDRLCVPEEVLYEVAGKVEFEVRGRVEESCACAGEGKGQVWICGLTLFLGKGALGGLPLVVGRVIVTEPADEVEIFSTVCFEYEIVLKVLESDGRQVSSLEHVVERDLVDWSDFERANSSYATVWGEEQSLGEGLEVAKVVGVLWRAESTRLAGLRLGCHDGDVGGGGD